MTKEEMLKKTRRINRIRRVLHTAESQVWFDAPGDERQKQVDKALDVLNNELSPKLQEKFLKKNHITQLTNFWVTVSDQDQVKGMVNQQQLINVFHQIVKYCQMLSARHDGLKDTTTTEVPSINPIE